MRKAVNIMDCCWVSNNKQVRMLWIINVFTRTIACRAVHMRIDQGPWPNSFFKWERRGALFWSDRLVLAPLSASGGGLD